MIHPKMFVTGDDCCPVKLLNLFKSKRPRELRDVGPFYLAVIDKPKDDGTWYRKSPMGVHTMGNFMKEMILQTSLASVPKKFQNQLARKTLVRKLKESGFVDTQIKNITPFQCKIIGVI